MTEETERIYVIPLKKKYFPGSKAAPTAVKRVKQYINHHMKVDESDIWIDESLNNAIWSKGKYKMPGKIRVKAVRFEDGVVEVYLPELEFEKSRRELLQEERDKKQPILRKEEVEPEEEMDEAGTDDYEVVPTADGDVKLKKKKQEKESAEDESEEGEEETEETTEEEEPAEPEPKESKASSETTTESEEEKKKTE
ncbi:MAG: 50S ribosomal protein L31e [Candidatus Thermoplasmatota archaeon]|nr:50S ribosomal protein L31e [Candidatus Thermoplasmatota archaeon]